MSPWWPVGVLVVGIGLTTVGIKPQIAVPLRADLSETIPQEMDGWPGTDREISEEERRVAGMDDYLLRVFQPADAAALPEGAVEAGFSIYVGYYRQQAQGRTIHSPKNCLPGAGWESLVSSRQILATSKGDVPVNRHLIANGPVKAVVLYWYQGRGRVEANEYVVKWELLRDQAMKGRSDEALVRVVVPVVTTVEAATEQAERVARQLVEDVDRALPARQLTT